MMVSKVLFDSDSVAAGLRDLACIVLVALMCLANALSAHAHDQSAVSQILAQAAAAEKKGNYAAAASYYHQVLQQAQNWPGRSDALVNVRVQLAKDYFLLRRYEESLNVLKPALAQSVGHAAPASAQVALIAGIDNLELNRLPVAINNLRQAIALDPQSGTARLALGDAYARSNRLEEAAEEYREQLRRTPLIEDAWYKLGTVYLDLSDETLRRFARRDPGNPVVRQLIAERLIEKGDGSAALPLLLSIVRANPRQPGLRADVGTALLDLGHTRAAAEQFQAELSSNAESPLALLGLAEIDALHERWPGTFKLSLQLIRFHPQELSEEFELPPPKPLTEAWRDGRLRMPALAAATDIGKLWVTWLSNQGTDVQFTLPPREPQCPSLSEPAAQTPGAWLTRACYEQIRSAFEGQRKLGGVAPTKLAETYFRLGDYEQARAVAETLLRRQPSNGWAAYWLARSYSRLGYVCFDRLSSINPGSARVRQILAQLDAARYNWSRAEKEYKSAIRLAPGLPDLHLGLGTVYWQAGDWPHAETELVRALKLDPASQVASYELGDCYIEQHRWAVALPYLQHAVRDPAVSYRARLDLAQAEEETGNDRSALQELLPVANDDRDGVLHYRLAVLYRKTGDATRAQQELARSQELRRSSAQQAQTQIDKAEEDLQKFQSSAQSARP
jgi:tetratricopeptide (TPR) repeat protein